jgi:D-alanine--poly(phosphoribitol) ligase subunit 1
MISRRTVIDVEPPVDLALATDTVVRARKYGLGTENETDCASGLLSHVDRVAARSSERPAVVDGDLVLTYRELATRARQIRHALRAAGCANGVSVAVAGGRGADLVALFLAIDSLGGVYIPLACDWPFSRTVDALELSRARMVVSLCEAGEDCGAIRAAVGSPVRVVELPGSDHQWCRVPDDLPRDQSEEARYCLFTSGSTGRPKGVLVEHRGMMNHLWAKVRTLSLTETDTVAFTAPPGFVISVWQMTAPLLVGATVVVVRDDRLISPRRLLQVLQDSATTVVELVPTVITWLVELVERHGGGPCLPELRWLVSTGEELPVSLARRTRAALTHVRLLNAFGSTECSDDVTHHEITGAVSDERVPVGTPIPNVRLYLLDRDDRNGEWYAVPPGSVGELFVGGSAVCRGYVDGSRDGDPTVFVDAIDPASPTGRLYRTGDLARFDGGLVHHVGRTGRQVKVAGVRIELNAVESVLRGHPEVGQAAVVAVDGPDRKWLAAFFTTRGAVDADELRTWLSGSLPPAMVPDHLVRLAALPLSANGKIDYPELCERVCPVREEQSC